MLKYHEFIELYEAKLDYKTRKRKNVSYRGIKTLGEDNQVYGSRGKGLYTAPLSNKAMAKTYGELYFVINAIPAKPYIVSSINEAEIFRQKLIADFCKKHNQGYSLSYFEQHTDMNDELIKLGYDGFVIKGREMVLYLTEDRDIRYYKKENDLILYYENNIE